MPNCAVIDNETNEQVNFIVAETTDLAPYGCRLVEIPEGFYWNGSAIVEIPNGS